MRVAKKSIASVQSKYKGHLHLTKIFTQDTVCLEHIVTIGREKEVIIPIFLIIFPRTWTPKKLTLWSYPELVPEVRWLTRSCVVTDMCLPLKIFQERGYIFLKFQRTFGKNLLHPRGQSSKFPNLSNHRIFLSCETEEKGTKRMKPCLTTNSSYLRPRWILPESWGGLSQHQERTLGRQIRRQVCSPAVEESRLS